jgi:hypothetical protein
VIQDGELEEVAREIEDLAQRPLARGVAIFDKPIAHWYIHKKIRRLSIDLLVWPNNERGLKWK